MLFIYLLEIIYRVTRFHLETKHEQQKYIRCNTLWKRSLPIHRKKLLSIVQRVTSSTRNNTEAWSGGNDALGDCRDSKSRDIRPVKSKVRQNVSRGDQRRRKIEIFPNTRADSVCHSHSVRAARDIDYSARNAKKPEMKMITSTCDSGRTTCSTGHNITCTDGQRVACRAWKATRRVVHYRV